MPPRDPSSQKARAAQRSPGFVALYASVCAGLAFLVSLPGVEPVLGIGSRHMAAAVVITLGATLVATATYHWTGEDSRAYRGVALLEAMTQQAAVVGLIAVGGRPASFLWVLHTAYAASNVRIVEHRRGLLLLYLLGPALLALVQLGRGDLLSFGFTTVAMAIGALVFATGSGVARTLLQLFEAQARLETELGLARERARIAADLHDGLGAALSAVAWRARAGEGLTEEQLAGELAAIGARASEGLDELRAVVWAMRGEARAGGELAAWLAERAAELCPAGVLRWSSTVSDERAVSGRLALDATRVLQEAIRNAVRHAAASAIRVDVTIDPRDVTLAIDDDGVGFDVEPACAEGRGLRGMRERARRAGGEAAISSRPGGTSVRVRLPRDRGGGGDRAAIP